MDDLRKHRDEPAVLYINPSQSRLQSDKKPGARAPFPTEQKSMCSHGRSSVLNHKSRDE